MTTQLEKKLKNNNWYLTTDTNQKNLKQLKNYEKIGRYARMYFKYLICWSLSHLEAETETGFGGKGIQ